MGGDRRQKGLIVMKKNTHNKRKKNRAIRSGAYTPGRNAFGEKAETHFVVLKRETALEQMEEAISQLDGSPKEFTCDMSCFIGHEDELVILMERIDAIMRLKAMGSKKDYLGPCSFKAA